MAIDLEKIELQGTESGVNLKDHVQSSISVEPNQEKIAFMAH